MLEKIKVFLKRNHIERALKTFIEAFASFIAVNVMTTDFSNIEALKGLLVGALASAISVAINYKKGC